MFCAHLIHQGPSESLCVDSFGHFEPHHVRISSWISLGDPQNVRVYTTCRPARILGDFRGSDGDQYSNISLSADDQPLMWSLSACNGKTVFEDCR